MEASEKSFEIFSLIDDTFRNVLLGVLGIVLAVMAMNPSPFDNLSRLLSSMSYSTDVVLVGMGVLPALSLYTPLYSRIYRIVVALPFGSLLQAFSRLVEFSSLIKITIVWGILWLAYSAGVSIANYQSLWLFYLYALIVLGTALLLSFIYLSYEMFSEVSRVRLVLPRGEREDFERVLEMSQTFRRIRRISNNVFNVITFVIFLVLSMLVVASSGKVTFEASFSPPVFVVSLLWIPFIGTIFFSMKSYELGIERFKRRLLDDYDAVIFVTGFEYGDIPRSFSIVSTLQRAISKYDVKEVPKNVYFRSLSSDRLAASVASMSLTGHVPYPDSEIYHSPTRKEGIVIIESYDALGGIMNLVPPILLPEGSVKQSLTHLHLPKTSALGTFPYSLKLGICVEDGRVDLEEILGEIIKSGQLGYSPAVLSHILNSIREKLGVKKLGVNVKLSVSDEAVLRALWEREELLKEVKVFIRDLAESGLEEALFYTVCHPDYCERLDKDAHVTLYITGYNQELPPGSVEYPLPLLVPILSVRAMKKLGDMISGKSGSLKIAIVAVGSIHSNPVIHYFIAHNKWNRKARGIYDLSNIFDFFEFRERTTAQGLAFKSIGPSQFVIAGYDHREKRLVTKFACGRETENNCFLVGMIPYKFVDFPYSPISKLVPHLKEFTGLNDIEVDFWMFSGVGHPGAVITLLGAMILPRLMNNYEGGIMMTELSSEVDPTFYVISFPVSKTLKLLKEAENECPNLGATNMCYKTFENLISSFEENEIRPIKIVGMRVD